MRCRRCGTPGAVELFNGVSCFWRKCPYFDPKAWDKATVDAWDYSINGDPAIFVEKWLEKLEKEQGPG